MTDRLAAAIAELVDAIRAELPPSAAAPDRLLSIDEAAASLGLGRVKVYGELQAGRLRSLTVGRRRLIPASAIADFIRSGGVEATRPHDAAVASCRPRQRHPAGPRSDSPGPGRRGAAHR